MNISPIWLGEKKESKNIMVRNKKRDTFTNTKEIESYVQLYGNKCEQLEEMDISKKKKLLKLTSEETEKEKRSYHNRDQEDYYRFTLKDSTRTTWFHSCILSIF